MPYENIRVILYTMTINIYKHMKNISMTVVQNLCFIHTYNFAITFINKEKRMTLDYFQMEFFKICKIGRKILLNSSPVKTKSFIYF